MTIYFPTKWDRVKCNAYADKYVDTHGEYIESIYRGWNGKMFWFCCIAIFQ
jgi:hypothetical protein